MKFTEKSNQLIITFGDKDTDTEKRLASTKFEETKLILQLCYDINHKKDALCVEGEKN